MGMCNRPHYNCKLPSKLGMFLCHFSSAYGCESQISQLGDLMPPLMMVSWALEAPQILDVILSHSIDHLCMKVNFVTKMLQKVFLHFNEI